MIEYLTTEEAANVIGVSRRRVAQMIDDGTLPSKRFGGAYQIARDDAEHARNHRVSRGRPIVRVWQGYYTRGLNTLSWREIIGWVVFACVGAAIGCIAGSIIF